MERFLLLTLAIALLAMVLAPPGNAQATMGDIADWDFDYNAWSVPGAPLPNMNNHNNYSLNTGTAIWDLPMGFRMEIVNVVSAWEMDLEIYFWDGTAFSWVASTTVDTVGGTVIFEDVITESISGQSYVLWIAFGTPGNDNISADPNADVLLAFGMEGDDVVSNYGSTYSTLSVLFGGDGNDTVRGAAGIDILFGDWLGRQYNGALPAGNDTVDGYAESDLIFGGPSVAPGRDVLRGGLGGDEIYGNDLNQNTVGENLIQGGDDPDILIGGDEDDEIEGGDGADHIEGGGGGDVIAGDAGCDDIWGDYGPVLDGLLGWGGNDGPDEIYGGDDEDLIFGGGGDDHIWGDAGDDAIDGGTGIDELYGGDGNDYLHDRDGNDNNELWGGAGNDWLHCFDTGDDIANGGTGTDNLYINNGDTGSNGTPTNGHPAGYNPGLPPSLAFEDFAFNEFWGTLVPNRCV